MLERLWQRFRRPPTPALPRRQSLAGVPIVMPHITVEESTAGHRILRFPRKPYLGGLLARFVKVEVEPGKVHLDELGTQVWDLIDGERTVERIVEHFAKQNKLHQREAEASVTAFLKMLMKRGFISVLIPKS